MEYLLGFDKMLSPIIIKVIYFLGLIAVLISAIAQLFHGAILIGICTLIFGALGVRIWCELLILAFRIHDNLAEINQRQKKNEPA